MNIRVVLCAGLFCLVALFAHPHITSQSGVAPPAAGGKAIYDAKCSQCHGTSGKGDGPAAVLLNPRPRDFTIASYKVRTTETGSLPTDEDITRSITEGLHGTSMPAWKPFLSADTLPQVVAHVKGFSPRFQTEELKPVVLGPEVPASDESVAAGSKVYETLKCAACHGTDGERTGATALDMKDSLGRDTVATNLTEPWTFRGGATARDVYLRFRTGMNGTPMPSFVDTAADKDMWDLANYVVSLGRKPAWQMTAAELVDHEGRLAKRALERPAERGKYLVKTLGCEFCHTPMQPDGGLVESMILAGGQLHRVTPFGDFVSYNLTSDNTTGLGNWTDDQIKAVLTRGARPDGSRMLPFPMPWTNYALLKSEDLNAIVAYLRTVPAISNKIPAPLPPNIAVYLWGKFKFLILQQDPPLYVFPGNAGAPAPQAAARSGPSRNYGDAPRAAMRPAGKARRVRISGIFARGATQTAGMQRRPNAAVITRWATSEVHQ